MEDESSSTTTMDRESSSDGIACTEDVANDDSNDPNANHNVLESAIILSDDALKQQQQQEESTNQTTPCHEQLATDLQRTDALLTSAKTWHIESIEDAIFCAENDPFPLGMLVRRFFPHWGFHDGTIIKVMRQLLQNQDKKHKSKSKSVRPVLVYRVKYDDGDQEDFTHNEICSLRQIYNQRSIPSTAKPVEQMPIGTIYLCQKDVLVKIDRHSTPRGMKEGEGGTVHVLYSQNGAPWTRTTLELIQLQLNVVCKLPPYYSKWGGNLVEDLEVIDVVEEESDYKKVNDLYEEDPELMAEIRKSRFFERKARIVRPSSSIE
uniref:Uncharacterized protein n=1 Tax=Leptocylindrus danicus TaxID=163516 RepID=A0A7S2NYR4_9STRA